MMRNPPSGESCAMLQPESWGVAETYLQAATCKARLFELIAELIPPAMNLIMTLDQAGWWLLGWLTPAATWAQASRCASGMRPAVSAAASAAGLRASCSCKRLVR